MGQILGIFPYSFWDTGSQTKRAVLLSLAGPEVQDVFDTLPGTGDDYTTALTKRLTSYFEPKKNVPFERHIFRSATQQPHETLDAFATRLRQLVKTCDYSERGNEMIRDQLVDKCHSKDLRRRFLRETDPGLTLDKALSGARAIEASNRNAALMESTDTAPVNSLRTSSHRSNKFQARPKPKPRSNSDALRAS